MNQIHRFTFWELSPRPSRWENIKDTENGEERRGPLNGTFNQEKRTSKPVESRSWEKEGCCSKGEGKEEKIGDGETFAMGGQTRFRRKGGERSG